MSKYRGGMYKHLNDLDLQVLLDNLVPDEYYTRQQVDLIEQLKRANKLANEVYDFLIFKAPAYLAPEATQPLTDAVLAYLNERSLLTLKD